MKIIGFCALHYGATYLEASIKSVIDHVDAYYVAYSANGSHGTQINERCPETKADLLPIAIEAAGNKLHWYEGNWQYEGQQRDSIFIEASDADVIITVDSDEIYTANTWRMIEGEYDYAGRSIKIPFTHYWRSFHKAITYDVAAPDRVVFPHGNPTMHLTAGLDVAIQHFGYAQSVKIVDYKQKIHGHRAEWRPEWFTTKFLANAQTDVHPCGKQWPIVNDVNPDELLPDFMKKHVNYHKALIE